MNAVPWIFTRVALAAGAAALGAGLGALIGWDAEGLVLLTVLGGAVGAAASALIDRIMGLRLLDWIRSDLGRPLPKSSPFWDELGHWISRALTLRERRTAQEATQHQEFLSAVEASPNGVLLLDDQERIAWCSATAAAHFGLNPEGDRLQQVTNLVRAPAFVEHLHRGDMQHAVVVPQAQGRGELSVMLRPYGQGKVLVLSQDVTERERADAMRRDFVANVSHEIRTPLTVLSGFIETLRDIPMTEPERNRVLGSMAQQAQRMEALVADLLTLARLEGSPTPGVDHWVPLGPLLAQLRVEAEGLSAGQHRLSFADQGEGLVLAVNPNELHSAVANLLSNAVRYTPPGGAVTLGWRMREDGGVVLEVSDNGPGIAPEHIGRLTERFYRVDGSRSRETGGTGLGLAIVKHVMQRHGGEVLIESQLGKGSQFRLVFPAMRVRFGAAAQAVLLTQRAAAEVGV